MKKLADARKVLKRKIKGLRVCFGTVLVIPDELQIKTAIKRRYSAQILTKIEPRPSQAFVLFYFEYLELRPRILMILFLGLFIWCFLNKFEYIPRRF
jgi:hypothetical protein